MLKSQKYEKFSERLQIARKKAGLSQAALAEKLDLVGHAQISRYESGKSFPDVKILANIADILSIDLHWLITGQPSPDLIALATNLKSCIKEHLTDLGLSIQGYENDLIQLRVDMTFDETSPKALYKLKKQKVKDLEVEVQKLKSEYNTIGELITKALPHSENE